MSSLMSSIYVSLDARRPFLVYVISVHCAVRQKSHRLLCCAHTLTKYERGIGITYLGRTYAGNMFEALGLSEYSCIITTQPFLALALIYQRQYTSNKKKRA